MTVPEELHHEVDGDGGEERRRRRFSQWAEKLKASSEVEEKAPPRPKEEKYLVSNDILQSKSKGIRFRNSPDLEDKCKFKVASFGAMVYGVRYGLDWLQVGRHFLPMCVDGKFVLLPQQTGDEDTGAGFSDDEDRCLSDVHPILADHVSGKSRRERERIAARQREELEAKAEAEWLAEARERPGAWAPGAQASGDAQEEEEQPEWAAPYVRGAVPPRGTGALYQVVAERVEVRDGPGKPLSEEEISWGRRYLHQNAVVELFDWDSKRQWRRFRQDCLGPAFTGWVMLDGFGPLLRPLGLLDRRLPLDPVYTAVYENNLGHLQQCIMDKLDLNVQDEKSHTPLMLAAQCNRMDCCVLLLHGRADASLSCPPRDLTAVGLAENGPLRALIEALAGAEVFDMRDFDKAFEQLVPEVQDLAEATLEKIAVQQAAQRQKAEEEEERARVKAERERLEEERRRAEADAARRREEQRQEQSRRATMNAEKARLRAQQETERIRELEEQAREQDMKAEADLLDKQRRLKEKIDRRRAAQSEQQVHSAQEEQPAQAAAEAAQAAAADEAARRRAAEEQAANRRALEEQALRIAEEEKAAKRRAAEAEATRKAAEEEATRAAERVRREAELSAQWAAEEAEVRRLQALEEEERAVRQQPDALWTCQDCGCDTPVVRSVCDFCDTPRGAGLAGQAAGV